MADALHFLIFFTTVVAIVASASFYQVELANITATAANERK